ncbi:lysozyme inhibitor LprI family protein [Microcoleus sp. bin38.metabat.b11b12b14.051]|uniref:lysozyme inhibitor LprI family protein n=1 Tax=Microcoleus sp. bin38.metabat.b11b12b14.051 TaxID=2742709 RepID=UPI0025FB1807|nr:lysozyme inhibitor LprI family protein [Microcoleus sp. bin38.metabat.b11b12b14.051]
MPKLNSFTKLFTLFIATAVIISTWATSVNAQRQPNCNNPHQNNLEIKECIRLRYEAADRRLNEVYQQLISKLSREERSLLSEAQKGWIQLKENNCHFEVYGSRMGTGYRGFLNECRERMTKQRTGELEKYLQR